LEIAMTKEDPDWLADEMRAARRHARIEIGLPPEPTLEEGLAELRRNEWIDNTDPDFRGLRVSANGCCQRCGCKMDSALPLTCTPVACRHEERVQHKHETGYYARKGRSSV
jgi:hypothetical protein